MQGNISKSKGFKGADGHTPSVIFQYNSETGDLYFSSDGILYDGEYVAGQNLATKEEVDKLEKDIVNVQTTYVTREEANDNYATKEDVVDNYATKEEVVENYATKEEVPGIIQSIVGNIQGIEKLQFKVNNSYNDMTLNGLYKLETTQGLPQGYLMSTPCSSDKTVQIVFGLSKSSLNTIFIRTIQKSGNGSITYGDWGNFVTAEEVEAYAATKDELSTVENNYIQAFANMKNLLETGGLVPKKAECDANGNVISETYPTREDVSNNFATKEEVNQKANQSDLEYVYASSEQTTKALSEEVVNLSSRKCSIWGVGQSYIPGEQILATLSSSELVMLKTRDPITASKEFPDEEDCFGDRLIVISSIAKEIENTLDRLLQKYGIGGETV
jgi:hypothetical protein